MSIKKQKKREPSQPLSHDTTGEGLYAKWFAEQPLNKQKELIDAGLNPELPNAPHDWVFEVKPDHIAYAHTDTKDFDEPATGVARLYTEDEVNEVVRRVVMSMQMTESPDALFQARCILIAFGIGDPPSETELAKQKGCSRQFVSKKVKRIQQMFNLSPSQFMRSDQACRAYSRAWHKQHPSPTNTPRPLAGASPQIDNTNDQ